MDIVEITPSPTKEKVRITNVLISWTMGIRNDMYFYIANEFQFSIASSMNQANMERKRNNIKHIAVFFRVYEQGN